MDWERVEIIARVVFVPIIFIAAITAMWYGALILMFSATYGKLVGLGLLGVALLGFMVGLWWAFGRPRHWFEPGRNTEYNPRR